MLEDQEEGDGLEEKKRVVTWAQTGCRYRAYRPFNALVRTWGLTRSETRIHEEVWSRGVIWSDSGVTRFALSDP